MPLGVVLRSGGNAAGGGGETVGGPKGDLLLRVQGEVVEGVTRAEFPWNVAGCEGVYKVAFEIISVSHRDEARAIQAPGGHAGEAVHGIETIPVLSVGDKAAPLVIVVGPGQSPGATRESGAERTKEPRGVPVKMRRDTVCEGQGGAQPRGGIHRHLCDGDPVPGDGPGHALRVVVHHHRVRSHAGRHFGAGQVAGEELRDDHLAGTQAHPGFHPGKAPPRGPEGAPHLHGAVPVPPAFRHGRAVRARRIIVVERLIHGAILRTNRERAHQGVEAGPENAAGPVHGSGCAGDREIAVGG